jgi:NAD dependent epimerase/dehydratase family enzyme
MTVLDTFFPVWLEMLTNNVTGTYNCTNPGVISHDEILHMYKKLVNPNFTWKNFTIEEQNQILDSKRSNNYLDTTKIQQYNVPDIYTAVRNVLENWES